MKQSEFNLILENIASVLSSMEPAFDEAWWSNANLTYRERLAQAHCENLSGVAKTFGLKFSADLFVRKSLPDADVERRSFVIDSNCNFVNGIWCKRGEDPYADGRIMSCAGSDSLNYSDGCQLAAGLVSLES